MWLLTLYLIIIIHCSSCFIFQGTFKENQLSLTRLLSSDQNHGLTPEIEAVRHDLLQLCDEYKLKEEAIWNSGRIKGSARKLRFVPELRDLEEKITLKILFLSTQSPIPHPFKTWGTKDGSPIDGSWKLRFTTAIDAKPEVTRRQRPEEFLSTCQHVNSTSQEITNIIRSYSTKDLTPLTTLKVSVRGKPLSSSRLQLAFRDVNVERPKAKFIKRFGFPFPRIPFSNALVNWKNEKNPNHPIGPFFDILYLDEDLRIHKTGRGDYFIQSRLYDVWDPMVGWKQISLV